MRVLFWKKHGHHSSKEFKDLQAEAAKTHQKNIERIVQSREDAGKVIVELKRNNITLELAKAIGH